MKRLTLLLFLAIACDKHSEAATLDAQTTVASVTPPAPTLSTPPATSANVARKVVELHISASAATMAFDPAKLTVATGDTVHLVIENKPPGALPHNWALVGVGTEAKVAAAGVERGQDAGWIAPGPDVLAYTPLAMPGEKAEVTFTAPAPGAYPYICTFPGHYVMMKGVLTVTP